MHILHIALSRAKLVNARLQRCGVNVLVYCQRECGTRFQMIKLDVTKRNGRYDQETTSAAPGDQRNCCQSMYVSWVFDGNVVGGERKIVSSVQQY